MSRHVLVAIVHRRDEYILRETRSVRMCARLIAKRVQCACVFMCTCVCQAKLRVGQPKVDVVNQCRKAVKTNNIQRLFKIIKGEYDSSSGDGK